MEIKNKRTQLRVRVSLPVEIYDILNDKKFSGTVVDISVGGVSLVTNEELPGNTPVSLTFTFEDIVYKKIPADIVREVKNNKEKYLGSVFLDLGIKAKDRLENSIRIVRARKIKGLQKETLYNIYR